MIEKLPKKEEDHLKAHGLMADKLNELVDAVNRLENPGVGGTGKCLRANLRSK